MGLAEKILPLFLENSTNNKKYFLRIYMKKLLLINPVPRLSNISKRGFKIQPLSLAYVAAVTPRDWNVQILDENFEKITGEEQADLIGITSLTSTVNRAYEIASQFKKRNIPIIMGGIHVSMVPDEALSFADSVVIGEVEDIWENIIKDFENKNLKKIYQGSHIDLNKRPILPRRDLLNTKYSFASIQTSRGCPFECEFCSVSSFNGKTFRQRTIKDIISEIEQIPQKTLVFIDDNLIGYSQESKNRAKDIFNEMIKRKFNKLWGCQASINFAEDEELLALAAKSGCCAVLMGLESINPQTLSGHMKKKLNSAKGVDFYYEVIRRLHKYRILLMGTMIFCNDEDDLEILPMTLEFIKRSNVDIPWPGVITPNPGTALYHRLLSENRLLYTNYPDDWAKYIETVPLKPKNYDATEFYEAYIDFVMTLFSNFNIIRRTIKTFCYSKSLFKTLITFNFNKSLRKRYMTGFLSPEYFLSTKNTKVS
jgi:radical SAM superfamily enzyme YgiQ (UPF0313 family)